jgi:uncharacterized protein (TIGR00255 family)
LIGRPSRIPSNIQVAVLMQSMTGFGSTDGVLEDGRAFTWTLRSVNGRGLDIKLRMPLLAEPLEPALRERLTKALGRGSIQASLALRETDASQPQLVLNQDVLDAVLAASETISARTGAPPPSVDGLLGIRGMLEPATPGADADDDAHRAVFLQAFDAALAALTVSRTTEGTALNKIVTGLLDDIASATHEADALPSRTSEAVQARLAQTISELTGAEPTLDVDKLHQEAVMLAAKADIREELDRLKAHVDAARALVAKGAGVGRDLNFLAQEFNREANTICSKSGDIALTRVGLRLKGSIDQLREQVQNIA